MTFTVGDGSETEFAMKLTTDPKDIYFNHKSIKEYYKNIKNPHSSIAMVGTTQIEIYYLLKDRGEADAAPTFSIQF